MLTFKQFVVQKQLQENIWTAAAKALIKSGMLKSAPKAASAAETAVSNVAKVAAKPAVVSTAEKTVGTANVAKATKPGVASAAEKPVGSTNDFGKYVNRNEMDRPKKVDYGKNPSYEQMLKYHRDTYNENPSAMFKTKAYSYSDKSPESVYSVHNSGQTTRIKASGIHSDSYGAQRPSVKTIFFHPDHALDVMRINQEASVPTNFIPHPDKPGHIALTAAENISLRSGRNLKKGEIIHSAPYETQPKVGHYPAEIWSSSPYGHIIDDGGGGGGKIQNNVHFGHAISDVKYPSTPVTADNYKNFENK